MRITIIPSDGAINIDGTKIDGFDLSFFDPSYHAIQWNNAYGEIEIKDPATGKILENREITDITDIYNQVFPMWKEKKDQLDAEVAQIQAQIDARNAAVQNNN